MGWTHQVPPHFMQLSLMRPRSWTPEALHISTLAFGTFDSFGEAGGGASSDIFAGFAGAILFGTVGLVRQSW